MFDIIGATGITVLAIGFFLWFILDLGADAGLDSFWGTLAYGLVAFLTLITVFPLIPLLIGTLVATATGSDLFGSFVGVLSWPTLSVGGYLLSLRIEEGGWVFLYE